MSLTTPLTNSGISIGTAGWSISSAVTDAFPGRGSHLERYARIFSAVEINSSFHRPHRLSTYQRWAAAVPDGFQFSVKLPKTISHAGRLQGVADLLDAFAVETAGLGEKLRIILVQLPPSFIFDAGVAAAFFLALRQRFDVDVACEPRHPTWFTAEADACLTASRVARVTADPVLAPGGERPGGWPGLRYHRLHGAPRVYYSAYEPAFLSELADTLASNDPSGPCWCMFDNTASGAAAANALELRSILGSC